MEWTPLTKIIKGEIKMPRMTAEEKAREKERIQWRTEEDARTLKRAEEIKRDPTRVRQAATHIQNELSDLINIVGVPKPRATPKKRTPAKKK